MVVITKIDICPPHILQQTITQLTKILKSPGARKIPIFIKNREDVVNTAVRISLSTLSAPACAPFSPISAPNELTLTYNTQTQFVSQRICPVFQVSNVTGESLDLVREFLNILPHHGSYDATAPFEFHVNDTFSVPFVGTVVSGVVKAGVAHQGDAVLIGPDSLGNFATTTIRSIERKRVPVPACSAGQSASFALKRVRRREVRKGMVVLPVPAAQPAHTSASAAKAATAGDVGPASAAGVTAVAGSGGAAAAARVSREFVAEVLILSHATTIKTRYQAMVHIGGISQTCAIIDIDRSYIRTGDRATVAFQFVQRPEFLTRGDRILFREGRTKGLGIVKEVGYDASRPLNPGGKTGEGGEV